MTFLYYASDSFASRAKVLVDSIKKFHPESKIVHIKPKNGPVGTYLPGMAKERLQKALELLEQGEKSVVIIGADCELFGRLEDIEYEFKNKVEYDPFTNEELSDIILVPHVIQPVADRMRMAQFYRTGHANADLMAFRNTENAKNCLRWLIAVTEDEDRPNGIFYEQTWLSSVPFLFSKVYIIRNPGYNVAYFNILERDFQYKDDKPYVWKYLPVKMVQYSGYVKGKPEKMSKYCSVNVTGDILKLFKEYDERIES